MSARPWVLAEASFAIARQKPWEVAVLPWAATEAHNLHLPYGTDYYESTAVAIEAARKAWEAGARPVVLPTVPFGVNTQQLDIPLTINMSPSTQAVVLADVIESLGSGGVRKLVILNGHGGNDFRQMIREAQATTNLFLCTTSWFRVPGTRDAIERPGDHADETETSLMMYLHPALVRPLEEAGPGQARTWRVDAFREGWAWAPRRWTEVTADTGVGDPSRATVEKGRTCFEAVTSRIAAFLVQIDTMNPDDPYEAGR